MKTSRQRILDYLSIRTLVSAAEVSRALKMTPANARHHLGTLEREGVIVVVGQQMGIAASAPGSNRRGRPSLLYSLQQRAASHNLANLAGAALAQLINGLSPGDQQIILNELAMRMMSESAAPPNVPNVHLTRRLTQAVQALNQQNYQARWEAHASGPKLILGHCPYATILEHHPELCQLDAALLAHLAASEVRQTARLEATPGGLPQCVFMVEIRSA